MAKKVAAKTTASEQGADDLAVLHPERSPTIAGKKVTVREYGFIEGLGLRPIAQPFLDDLHSSVSTGRVPELEEILVILGSHAKDIEQLIACAADVSPEWVAGLNQDDGYHLLMVWWEVNGPFFIRSVFNRIRAELAVRNQHAGATSTPSSSPEATEAPPPSAE